MADGRPESSLAEPDDLPPISAGERLAAPWFREVASGARHLTKEGGRSSRMIGARLVRHIEYNRGRLARLFDGLDEHERSVLAVLPYLFDANRSGLPGYHRGRFTLNGVCHFEANATLRDAVGTLFGRDVARRSLGRHKPPVRAIWVDSDVGTIVDPDDVEVVVYLVMDVRLMGQGAVPALGRRFNSIADWAGEQGLELRFVVVDPARTQSGDFGDLRGEPARSARALDDLYRTGIYLAGELPVWWCVPPRTEPAQHLKLGRTIERSDLDDRLAFVDLGPVRPTPDRMRWRADVARLDRGDLSPLAFLLHLSRLVLDIDRRMAAPSDRLKAAIQSGRPAIVDPILQLVDEVTDGFERLGRQTIVRPLRQLAWLKVGMFLARSTNQPRAFVERFRAIAGPCVVRWGYEQALFDMLDGLVGWPGDRVDAVDREVRALLLELYGAVTEASRAHPGLFDQASIASLGRRLLALIGAESGRVRAHFTYLLGENRAEEHLVLLEDDTAPRRSRWAIHRHVVRDTRHENPEGESPMWMGESIAAAASWAVVNGVVGAGTAVRPVGVERLGTAADLREVFDRLRQLIGRTDPIGCEGRAFRAPRRVRKAALIAAFEGFGDDAVAAGVKVLPENWDILNYGPGRSSRVRDVSVVTVDSWDAVHCRRFRGAHALMAAMRSIYGGFDPTRPFEAPPEVLVPRGTAVRATRNRLRQIMRGADRIALSGRARRRAFIYEVGGRFQVLRRDEGGVRICSARSLRGGARLLGTIGEGEQQVTIDRLSPTLGELRAIFERQRSDPTAEVCVGWSQSDGAGQILVCDEIGRLYGRRVPLRQLDDLLVRLVRRIIHLLRTRVRDMRTLRKVLRVFEMRDVGSLGSDVQLREDTVRVISRLAEPRPRHPELFLRGQLGNGRDGVQIEYDGTLYDPRQRGRRFAVDVVRAMIANRARYAQFDLFIEASSVRFGDAAPGVRERGVVKHLRLIDVYERHLGRALRAIRDGKPAVMTSSRTFSGRKAS